MNKRRLLKLADLLEADAKNKTGIRFDIDVVACHAKPVRPRRTLDDGRRFGPGDVPTLDCGTAACAIGLAAISGAFKRQGFSFDVDHDGFTPTFNGVRGFGIADTSFFGLTERQQCFLFHPFSYKGEMKGAKGERGVAKRIRDFVAGKTAHQ